MASSVGSEDFPLGWGVGLSAATLAILAVSSWRERAGRRQRRARAELPPARRRAG